MDGDARPLIGVDDVVVRRGFVVTALAVERDDPLHVLADFVFEEGEGRPEAEPRRGLGEHVVADLAVGDLVVAVDSDLVGVVWSVGVARGRGALVARGSIGGRRVGRAGLLGTGCADGCRREQEPETQRRQELRWARGVFPDPQHGADSTEGKLRPVGREREARRCGEKEK